MTLPKENGTLFSSIGTIHYGKDKLIVSIERDISEYYRSLIPKYISHQSLRYAPHISVVRKEMPEQNLYSKHWNKYEGKEVEFYYSNTIYWGQVYIWLNIYSVTLENLRAELGLKNESLYIQPPSGFIKTFHTTLGNFKGLKPYEPI